MLHHGGNRIAEAFEAHGVRAVFTLCGGHISPILSGSKARGIRIVDVRDEATAVFAADAAARLSGTPGVAAVTAGPGLTNTITALKNAQLARSPVVLIGGAAPTQLQGRGALQDIDQRALIAPHVKWMRRVRRVRELGDAMTKAFAVARQGVPGPVFIECPVDLVYPESLVRQWYHDAGGKGQSLFDGLLRYYLERKVGRIFAGGRDRQQPAACEVVVPLPPDADVGAAARALIKAQRPLLVLGSQVVTVADEAVTTAGAISRLGVPAYLSGMARGLLGRNHPLQMRHQRRRALREADTVVLAGVPCDFRLDYGRHIRCSATLISANRSAKDAKLNRRPQIAAIGDAGRFLQRLAERMGEADSRWQSWIEQLRRRDNEREVEIEQQAQAAGDHVNPLALLRAVDRVASDTAMLVADGGDFVATASYILRPRGPLSWLDPGPFGTLGVGAGFALGAAVSRPDAEVWIIFGDGACGFGLCEFDTFVRHNIPVIAVVGNDAGWTQIAREQVKMLNDDVATRLARTDYHEVVRGFGGEGFLIRSDNEVSDVLAAAQSAARKGMPVLVNAWLSRTEFREGSLSM
jgi:acetolactate synthase-1/2/3 large subunit